MTDELAMAVADACLLTGTFTLRSGAVSHTYFDKYQLAAEPGLLAPVIERLQRRLPPTTLVLAGLELGGVPLATGLSLRTGLPLAIVRTAPKTYGTRRVIEGAVVTDREVCVIEDVVTTGGAVVEAVTRLREAGAIVTTALCVLLRDGAAQRLLADHGITLVPVWTHPIVAEEEVNPAQN